VPMHRERIPLSIRVPAEAGDWAGDYLSRNAPGEGPLIAVQAGASDVHKMWHPSSFIRACRILRDAAGARFVFVGGAKERELATRIAAVVDAPGSAVAAGETTLERLCGLLRRADLMITNDTGPMHLAAAVGTTVLSLALGPVYYSNTGPFGEGHVVFQPSAPCAPCAFNVRCVNPECKNLVTAEAVAAVALRLLRGEPLSAGCLGDGPEFAGGEVYRSAWGEDGLLDYVPLLSRPDTVKSRLARAYRRVWFSSLLDGGEPPGARRLVPVLDDGLFPVLRRIEAQAVAARDAAAGILEGSRNPGRHVERLKAGMSTIRGCSDAIREIGLAVTEVNSLCRMFAFEEENMKEGGLEGAARENVEIFGNLLRRTRSLAYLLAGEQG
jgi:hypothetical protein